MSKNISYTDHVLTDEEKAWFESRREEWKIERNAMIFAETETSEAAPPADGEDSSGSVEPGAGPEEPVKMTAEQVEKMKVEELRDELESAGIDHSGNKSELVDKFVEALRERGQLAE